MKKNLLKVIFLILIVLIFILISKVCIYRIIRKSYDAIEKFKKEENRCCSITRIQPENSNYTEKVFFKQNILKYIRYKENSDLYCEWKNVETDEHYNINITKEEIYINDLIIKNENILLNIPRCIRKIVKNDKVTIDLLFKVYYIIPIKYNDKSCYKIVTKAETIIIDKETYLPVYSSIEMINSNEDKADKIENIYEFKVGNVTDEDIALPDLKDYTVIEQSK